MRILIYVVFFLWLSTTGTCRGETTTGKEAQKLKAKWSEQVSILPLNFQFLDLGDIDDVDLQASDDSKTTADANIQKSLTDRKGTEPPFRRKLLQSSESAPAGHPFPDLWEEWCTPPTTPKWYQWCNSTWNTEKTGEYAGQPKPDETGWTPPLQITWAPELPATGADYFLCCRETFPGSGERVCTGQDNEATSDPGCPGAEPLPDAY